MREQKGLKVEHIGFVTKNIAKKKKELSAVLRWRDETEICHDEAQKVKVQFLDFGNTKLELIEPASKDCPITKFLEKRGEGLHHIAYEVTDAQKALDEYKKKGFTVAQEIWKAPAFDGRKVFFLHPKSTGGLLLEFIEADKS